MHAIRVCIPVILVPFFWSHQGMREAIVAGLRTESSILQAVAVMPVWHTA